VTSSSRSILLARYAPFAALCGAIFFVSSLERAPIPEPLLFWNSDKLFHALAYAVVGAAAAWPTLRRRGGWGPAAFVESFLLAAGYGVLDEWHQSFVPGRSATLSDVVADAVGAALGAWLLGLWWARTKAKARR
jgi:VanZ family protein